MPATPEDRRWSRLCAGLLLLASALVLATFRDYGLTWDEGRQAMYGRSILRWFQTLGHDRTALSLANLSWYGGFFEVVAELVARVVPGGRFAGRHLATAAFGLAGVLATWRLGRLAGGARVGFVAALFLLCTPCWYGHLFNNPKDVPFATLSAWVLVALYAGLERLPRLPASTVTWTAVAMGLMLGVRAGGVFHLGYLGLIWMGGLALHHLRHRSGWRRWAIDAARLTGQSLLVLVVAWVVMIAFWPFAHIDPIGNPLLAMRATARFRWNGSVLFQGALVPGTEIPWHYLPVYLGLSLPEFYFLGLLAGALAAAIAVHRRRVDPLAAFRVATLACVVVCPVVAAIAVGSTLYDGVRHFLFLLPPIAVLAAAGLCAALDLAPRAGRRAAVAVTGALLLAVGIEMVQLHPYQYVYYNHLAGGLAGAAGRYETDYWGLSYREAVEWVLANYRPGRPGKIRIANCSKRLLTGYYVARDPRARRRFVSVGPRASADVFVSTTRWACHRRPDPVLHVVERQNVPLAYVFRFDPPHRGRP